MESRKPDLLISHEQGEFYDYVDELFESSETYSVSGSLEGDEQWWSHHHLTMTIILYITGSWMTGRFINKHVLNTLSVSRWSLPNQSNKMEGIKILLKPSQEEQLRKGSINFQLDQAIESRALDRMNELTEDGVEFY